MVAPIRTFGTLALALLLSAAAFAQDALRPRVYPNPVATSRVVTVEAAEAEGATAEIVDLLGRRVSPDADLPAGTYLVRLSYEDGRIGPHAPVTLATPGRVTLRVASAPLSAPVPESSVTTPEYILVYIVGDSQGAGKGDEAASCAMRPDSGSRGYIYQRSLDRFEPVCSPAVDLYNGSVIPALVDEVFQRYGKIALVVSYTVKGSNLTPEAVDTPLYWYIGDATTEPGEAFDNAKVLFKRAKRTAKRDFGDNIQIVGGFHSFGRADARKYQENGTPSTAVFSSRLQGFDDAIHSQRLKAIYFEIGSAPGKPQFDGPLGEFRLAMEAIIPSSRIASYSDYVFVQHTTSGLSYSQENWYADKSGHLGSLGLDYLGTQFAIVLDL